jgi:Sulfotransferase family
VQESAAGSMTIVGNVDEISRRRVVGWACDRDAPEASLTIAILINGRELGRCPASLEREGLKEHLGGNATGLYGFEFAFDPPLSVFDEYRVEVKVAGAERPLPRGVRVLPAPPRAGGRLAPIIITSTGRSGTTLLMSEFAARPDIVVAGPYPFEIKLVGYYSAAFRTLVSPEDRINSTDPATMFASENRFHIGHNPYNSLELHRAAGAPKAFERFFEQVAPAKYSELFRVLLDEYYSSIKTEQGKHAARFFAEKGELDENAREGARHFLGRVHELVVVRDPRDLLCSAMKFWKLEPAEALAMLKTTLPRLEEIHDSAASDSFFLRYEDLITDPAATRAQIYRFLGLDFEPGSLSETDPKLFERHGTSARPADSVQRWERDLDPDLAAACNDSFGSYIERFGYAVNGGTRRAFRSGPAVSGRQSGMRVIGGRSKRELERTPGYRRADPAFELIFGLNGNSAQYQGQGWGAAEDGFTWTTALESRLEFPRPQTPADYLLRLFVRPFLSEARVPVQRLTVAANGVALGTAAIAADIAVVECDMRWTVLERHSTAAVSLLLPDAARPSEVLGERDDRLLGLRFERVELVAASAATSEGDHPWAGDGESHGELRALMVNFQNIGENCEFGFVQRRCGVDPTELLRFSSSPIPRLLAALKSEFAELGDPDQISIELSENGYEYMVHEEKYGFVYHAWVLAGEMTPAEVHRREVARLPSLVHSMIEDLRNSAKILVYHGLTRLAEPDVVNLLEALRSYGPNTLLWVELADEEHPPGTVEWAAPHLLKAFIERFAPVDDPNDMSLDTWVTICRQAYRLWEKEQPRRAPETAPEQGGSGFASAESVAEASEAIEPPLSSSGVTADEVRPETESGGAYAAPVLLRSVEPAPAGVPSGEPPDLSDRELVLRFESIGENCEFGLVQRRCGAEPLGLFRFASAPLPKLMAGLEQGFEGLSDPDNLEVQLSSNGREYMVYDRKYQLLYHAWVLAEEASAEAVHQREIRRLPLLIRKLIEDLKLAEKIFIFHGMEPLSQEDAQGLLARLRNFGPNTLLWLELADAAQRPGTVEWAGEGLLKGYMDRFAPGDDAHDLSLDCWVAVCREAYRLWRDDKAGQVSAAMPAIR